ncbi:MAG: TIGR03667 family PPOX class F420-dependent oxidoreductase [Candidatus Limnocylindrales bacterium]|jgi:PPOX class probable F420-dependent enzyme
MSDPAADRIRVALEAEPAAWASQHLVDDIVGWLTTVAADGRVQSSPVAFLWDGETVLVYSQPETPKTRNIAANSRVSFHLNTDEYGDHVLVFEGTAALDAAAPPWSANPAMVAKYREPLGHWELDETETSRDFSVAIRIRPTRVRAW